MENPARDKHFSLFCPFISSEEKIVWVWPHGPRNTMNLETRTSVKQSAKILSVSPSPLDSNNVGSSLIWKLYTRLEHPVSDKHYSLFCPFISSAEKIVWVWPHGPRDLMYVANITLVKQSAKVLYVSLCKPYTRVKNLQGTNTLAYFALL